MNIAIRHATFDDVPNLLKLEKCWPESERATEANFLSRLNLYPDAYYVGFDIENKEQIVAAATSFPITYDPANLTQFTSWENATNDGNYHANCQKLSNHTMYLAASCVDTQFRGGTVYVDFMNQVFDDMKSRGSRHLLSGNILPGYDRYCIKNGEISAVDYVFKTYRGRPIDPFLKLLYSLGFVVPNKDHVIKDYYHDDPSRHYATIIVNDLSNR